MKPITITHKGTSITIPAVLAQEYGIKKNMEVLTVRQFNELYYKSSQVKYVKFKLIDPSKTDRSV